MLILIVDDHVLVRDALKGALLTLRPQASVIEAGDAAKATEHLESGQQVDLLVLDLALPDRDGMSLLAEWRERHVALPVVVLSGSDDRERMVRALELGALGYVPKSASREILLAAFGLVLSGGVYVPPEALGPSRTASASGEPTTLPPRDDVERPPLTERQADVLALMRQGMNNKTICRRLGIAEATVKNHVSAILRAFGASNRTEAVIAAGQAAERERR